MIERRLLRLLRAASVTAGLPLSPIAYAEQEPKGFGDARAEPPVDVVVHDAPRARRIVSVEWNPLALLTIGKLSGNVVITPVDHHAMVLSPFYAWATTAPISVYDAAGNQTQLPEQKFSGFGGELGYRYYFDPRGPRGFFLGPSFILGSFTATAMNGDRTPYLGFGLAADAGYQMLVADRVALTLGGGVQGLWTSSSIPEQQFPARIYANRGVLPRLLFSIGCAF